MKLLDPRHAHHESHLVLKRKTAINRKYHEFITGLSLIYNLLILRYNIMVFFIQIDVLINVTQKSKIFTIIIYTFFFEIYTPNES